MKDPSVRASLRFGWTAIAVFMLLGLVLESLHLIKAPFYLDIRLRRELWTLAHAHGTLLGLINIAFAVTAERFLDNVHKLQRASRMLRLGSLLVPLGFFLGGVANAEGDPSLAIVLVPVGAVLALYAVGTVARGGWRTRD